MSIQNLASRFKKIDTDIRGEIALGLFIYKCLCEMDTYVIPENNSFNEWLEMGNEFDISNVSDSISALLRLNKDIGSDVDLIVDNEINVFHTLQTEKHTLGETCAQQTLVLRNIIWNIKDLPMMADFKDVITVAFSPNQDWFADNLSLRAFLHAIKLAEKAQAKLDKSPKGALIMFDDELLPNPKFEVKFDGINSSVHILVRDDVQKLQCTYSLCGCTSDPDTGQIYARKNEVNDTFKRISFYKKY